MAAWRAPRKTILVVEDSPGMRGVFEMALTRAGYVVVSAQTAAEALALLSEDAPDAIVLDVALPDRSGLAVLEELGNDEHTRSVPVLLVSGYASLLPEHAGSRATSIIQKPFDVRDLLAEVKRALA